MCVRLASEALVPLLLVVLASCAYVATVNGSGTPFSFEVASGDSKCLGHDLRQGELFRGKYKVLPAQRGIVKAIVSDPFQSDLVTRQGEIEASFVVTAAKNGDHRICFYNTGSMTVTIELSLRVGAEAKDYTEVAHKNNLKPLELELRRLEDLVVAIQGDMQFSRRREQEERNVNESTNTRVLFFSIFSMIILVVLGTWQIFYLKKFFKSKKMI